MAAGRLADHGPQAARARGHRLLGEDYDEPDLPRPADVGSPTQFGRGPGDRHDPDGVFAAVLLLEVGDRPPGLGLGERGFLHLYGEVLEHRGEREFLNFLEFCG